MISGASLLAAASTDKEFASFDVPLWAWAALVGTIAVLLVGDLLLVHRTPHDIGFKEAAIESAVWITIGLSFTFVILGWQGGTAAGEYLSGYLIEKSLSVDNVFVWAVIFSYFAVPATLPVPGAVLGHLRRARPAGDLHLRRASPSSRRSSGSCTSSAASCSSRPSASRDTRTPRCTPDKNPVLRLVRRVVPSTDEYDGQKLFSRKTGKLLATPLFAVLILVETTDVVFAVDSIPAILAVSREPFIVFASNAFAILGLRALYFLLAGMAGRFRYLNVGLGIILAFVGLKMLLVKVVHLPTWVSLAFITVVLTITILTSLRAEKP